MRPHAVFLMCALLAATLHAREVIVTVLATTDMHGNIYPYDYLTGRSAARGLAKIATLIKAERKTAPGALLVDCGDTIQGSQLVSVYQQRAGAMPQPMPEPMTGAMNLLRYDAMAVGNHEYNYGLKSFDQARNEAKFAWLSANTETVPGSGRKPLEPFIIKNIDGVKVGVIGITTPAVPTWEKPENYKGYTFVNARTAAEKVVNELRAKHQADVVLIIAHSGLDEKSTQTSKAG